MWKVISSKSVIPRHLNPENLQPLKRGLGGQLECMRVKEGARNMLQEVPLPSETDRKSALKASAWLRK